MKRIWALMLALLLSAVLFGCVSQAEPAQTTSAPRLEASTAATAAPTQATTVPATTVTPTEPPTEPPPPPEPLGSLLTLTVPAAQNPALAQDLEFAIDEGNGRAVLTLTYQYYADLATLCDARLQAQCEAGFARFTCRTAQGVNLMEGAKCIVTDENGTEKVYELVVDRTIYRLPIVNITLANGKDVKKIDREKTTNMTFSLDCSGATDYAGVGNISGTIRGRGNSTWKWAKKPYKIELSQSLSLLGLDDNKDWILLANYADKSLIRNTLAYEMGRVLDNIAWSPHQYPVDLFINGVYQGVYSLGEHMEVAGGRVELTEDADADTGFLIEIGGVETAEGKNVYYFHTSNRLVRYAAFKAPDGDTITEAQRQFIRDYFQKAEDAILAGKGYEKYIDVDSFIDWILLQELSYNMDGCFRRSCFLTKEKSGKLKMGPIWDYDLAFGNFSVDNKKYNNLITVGSDEEGSYIWENWCTYLLQDPEFCERLYARWQQIRDPLLNRAYEVIDTYSALLDGSQQENFQVWKIWNKTVGYQSSWCKKADTYEKQIQYLKDFLEKRAAWMDKNLPR